MMMASSHSTRLESEPSTLQAAEELNGSVPALRIELLGSFRVSRDGRSIDDAQWRLSKARGLVKLLALSPGQQLHREQVIDYLWPDLPPDAAMNNLHQVLFAARRALAGLIGDSVAPAQVILMQRQILLLQPPVPLWIDALVFEERAEHALSSDDPALAYACLDLYAGDLLPEDRYEEWAEEPRERLRDRSLTVLAHLARLHEEREEAAPAIDALRRLIAADSVQEDAHVRLMRLYALTGRSQQALRQYARLRDILERELDALPSREADRLNAAILDGRFPPAPVQPAPLVTAPSPDVAPPPSPSEDFVNRERELDSLRRGLDVVRAGRGAVVLVGGEPGIGKTRVVEEFTQVARANGARVRWGRCYEGEGSLAYWPWMQLLRDDLVERDPAALLAEMGNRVGDIARLMPDIRERVPAVPVTLPLDPDLERARLFDSVVAWLTAPSATNAGPLVLVFDDLHWADRSSLQLLEYVADEIRAHPVLILGIYRDSGLDRRHPLTPTLTRLARADSGQRLHLSGLSVEHVGRVSELTSGRTPPAGLIEVIHGQTEGNPLFVREVVRLLVDEGRFDAPADIRSWRVTIPRGVREAIALRLDRLSDGAIRALEIAAVIGRDFDLGVLRRVCALPRSAVIEVLEEALAAGVLVESPARHGAFHFAHALTQQTLYDDVSAVRRVDLHRRIGAAIEAEHAGDLAPYLPSLASHYLRAAEHDDDAVEPAIEYATLAGAQAIDRVAWDEALDYLRNALDLLGRSGRDDPQRRIELLLSIGRAKDARGQFDEARASFREAAMLAGALDTGELLARAALEYDACGGRDEWIDEGEIELFESALKRMGHGDHLLSVRLLSRLAIALYYCVPGSEDRRAELSERALAMAERLGDPATLAQALVARIYARWTLREVSERLADATRVIELAETAGAARLQLIGHAWRIAALLELGEIAEVDAAIDAYERVGEQLNLRHSHVFTLVRRTMRALMRGEYERAERMMQDAMVLGQRVAPGPAAFNAALQSFILWHDREACPSPEPALVRLIEQSPENPLLRSLLVVTLLNERRRGEAERLYADLIEEVTTGFPQDIYWLATLVLIGEACADLQDRANAPALIDQLRPYAGLVVSLGANPICLGSAAHYLARLAALIDNQEEAEAWFASAIDVHERIASPPMIASTLVALATYRRSLTPAATPADEDILLDRAAKIAAPLGMTRLERRIDQLRREWEGGRTG
jgi:DNA-binding SARP family transcriptional activator